MSTLTWITEKELEREIKNKGDQFYSAGEKMRNASGHQGENEWQRKRVNWNAYKISSIKRVTRKFHFVVVQNNGKEMYKKSVLHVQSCFFAN